MVSSFVIYTSIRVPSKYRAEFNEFMETLEESIHKIEGDVPAYFDAGFYDGGEGVLDTFLQGKYSNTIPIKDLSTNWRCDARGYLYDNCEKFHYAISTLHYCIEHFFKPRNIYLDGNIIGVNTDYPMVYAYHVIENDISLHETATRAFLKIYDTLYGLRSDAYEYDRVENIANLMCKFMDISL